jgi:hypothetical protein
MMTGSTTKLLKQIPLLATKAEVVKEYELSRFLSLVAIDQDRQGDIEVAREQQIQLPHKQL